MRNVAKAIGCLLAAILWAKAIQRWAPQTVAWLIIAVVPSLGLALLGGFLILKVRYPQLFR